MLQTSLRFFDTQPIGRILNRFAKDLGYADEQLPESLFDCTSGFVVVFGAVFLVASLNAWLFVAIFPLLFAFVFVRRLYIRTSREIKRIEGLRRSPMYSRLSTTLSGLMVIRSHRGMGMVWRKLFEAEQDAYTRAMFTWVATGRWLSVRIDFLVFCFTAATAFGGIAAHKSMPITDLGLSIVYVLQIAGQL